MIVLKILMWILLVILGIILLVLILPVSAKASFIGGKFSYSVKLFFLPVINSDKKGIADRLRNLKKKKKKKAPDEKKEDMPLEDEPESDIPEDDLPEGSAEEPAETVVPDKDKDEKPDKQQDATDEIDDTEINDIEINDDDFDGDEEDDISEKEEKKKKISIDFIIDLWEAADRPVLKIFKGIKFSELYIDFAIANEDAYKCALNYGRISGAIYQLLGWMSVLFNVKLKTVDIIPAFAMKKSRFDVSAKVSLCLITPVIAGIWFLIIYLFKVFIPARKKKKSEVK